MRRFHLPVAPYVALAAMAVLNACDTTRPSDLTSSVPTHVMPPVTAASAEEVAEQNRLLATVRAATARYHRIEAALANGYVQGSPCEARAAGGMGAHFRKNALIDGVVDPTQPEILAYEPQKNGEWRLVVVEFLVPAAVWDATNSAPPMLGNQVFEDRRLPGSGGPPFPNYGLHVWVWQNNPSGMYSPWNPTVTCDFAP
jgi:hypothetical protein